MEPDSELVAVLRRLAAGEIEPQDWIAWWQDNADRVAVELNRGQFLRLRPRQTPEAEYATFQSQVVACEILTKWGVGFQPSARYELVWKETFQESGRRRDAQRAESETLKETAAIFMDQLRNGVRLFAQDAASHIRQIVGADKLTVEQHKALEARLRSDMSSLIWYILGTFDNVGCRLPEGVLGYDIVAHPSGENIRDGDADYADMWLEFELRGK